MAASEKSESLIPGPQRGQTALPESQMTRAERRAICRQTRLSNV